LLNRMKTFEVPEFYRSPLLNLVKEKRKAADKLKKDFTPTCIDFGAVQFYIARHFGFCYGVENAIEIAFKAVTENPGKRIYLLSEMIHNPQVNADLIANGVSFILDTYGKQLIPWDSITADDVVIIPAFGTTLQTEDLLKSKGINPLQYNTTCPFVERVWKKADQIAKEKYSIILHGKPTHEETKATFSHSSASTPSVIVNDLADAKLLAQYITKQKNAEEFYIDFAGKFSEGFDATKDLERVGVVNQTTMLAEDTQEIAEFIKQTLIAHYALDATTIATKFADTRDTLCYATNDNQSAVKGMLLQPADISIVVGGYNSSNTSHLVELSELVLPTYFINGAENIIDATTIDHHHFRTHQNETIQNYLPTHSPIKILITSGASCPDAVVEKVMDKIVSYYPNAKAKQDVMQQFA
jgi:4-hydroxy-3-methylbut-2-en-1-yl diphosphate reductase